MKTTQVHSVQGTAFGVKNQVLKLEEIVCSHTLEGCINPAYPSEFQPRNRQRIASQAQITQMAANLNPALLGETALANDGAPIVWWNGDKYIALSGNGRLMAMALAHQLKLPTFTHYQTAVVIPANQGKPCHERAVLVRVLQTKNQSDALGLASQANVASVALLAPSEQAHADAQRIAPLLCLMQSEADLTQQPNAGFVARFFESVPTTERNAYLSEAGGISKTGRNRLQFAIFACAYGQCEAVERLMESLDDGVKNVSNAMLKAAPAIAHLNFLAKQGLLAKTFCIGHTLGKAVGEFASLRAQGVSVQEIVQQVDFTGQRWDALTTAVLTLFENHRRSAKQITTTLLAYALQAAQRGNPSQGGLLENNLPTPLALLQEQAGGEVPPQHALFGLSNHVYKCKEAAVKPQPKPPQKATPKVGVKRVALRPRPLPRRGKNTATPPQARHQRSLIQIHPLDLTGMEARWA